MWSETWAKGSVSNRILKAVCLRITLVCVLAFTLFSPFPVSLGAQSEQSTDAQLILADMSASERIGQLFLVTFPGYTIRLDDPIVDLIANYHVGGVVLQADADNIAGQGDTLAQVAELTNQLQGLAMIGASSLLTETIPSDAIPPTSTPAPSHTPLPLFIAVQQEGDGPTNDQLLSGLTQLPSQMAVGATWQTSFAESMGGIAGRELSALGFNMLLGPSLDVLEIPNPAGGNDLAVRSFGGSPHWVGQMGQAFTSGVHAGSDGRMAVIGKHFPGSGNSDRPLGEEIATVRRTLAELQSAELIPFGAVTDPANDLSDVVEGLMTTHISYQGPEDDSQISTGPLTFDPQALQAMLALPEFSAWRESGGLLVSDELGSQAVRRFFDDTGQDFPHRRVAKDALLAGHDLLYVADFALEPDNYDSQVANIKDTITWFQERYDSDPAFQSRVDDAVLRILQLKLDLYGQDLDLQNVILPPDQYVGLVGRAEDQATVFEIAENAISLVASYQTESPGSPGPEDRVVIFTDVRDARQCSDCPVQPYIAPTIIEEKILELYGPAGSDQIQLNNIRSFTYADLKTLLTTQPEPTPTPSPPAANPPIAATPSPASSGADATATPGLVENVEFALQNANWIIFAALDVTESEQASDALNLFLAQRPDIVRDSNIVLFAYNAPYFLDSTEVSKLSAYFTVYSKIDAFVDASVRALFQEAPLTGAPPVNIASINYDLKHVTQPHPDQIIDLYIAQDGELIAPAGEEPLEVVVGESLRLLTGPIVDRNGNPVPDGTAVQFWQTDRLQGFTSFIAENPTTDGVAELVYILEARTGQFRITATTGDAKNSQQVDIIIGDNVRIVVVTLTPGPTPSSTPTLVPTATSTPSPSPTPTPTVTPAPITPEPGIQIPLATFSNLSGIIAGLGLVGIAGLLIASMFRLTNFSGLLRLVLLGLLGGLVLYNYYVLQLPGSVLLSGLGNWAGFVVTTVGGILILLIVAPLLRRSSSGSS